MTQQTFGGAEAAKAEACKTAGRADRAQRIYRLTYQSGITLEGATRITDEMMALETRLEKLEEIVRVNAWPEGEKK